MTQRRKNVHRDRRKSAHTAFGRKGVDAQSRTFAEMLLSGEPMERRKSQRKSIELRRPTRQKQHFGRRELSELSEQKGLRIMSILKRRSWKTVLVWVVAMLLAVQAFAMTLDVPVPTMGGRQLWTDIRVGGDWRVQCHAWTDQCRLLNGFDIQYAWGGVTAMMAAYDRLENEGRIPAPQEHVVVFVHGLGRSAHSFDKMADAFERRGLDVVTFNYASTQGTIADHADALRRVVAGLRGVKTVSFVTHSLGGPVVRQAVSDGLGDRAVGRVVMLAPPNAGSRAADTLSNSFVMRTVLGPVLVGLQSHAMRDFPNLESQYAVVAGRVGYVMFGQGDGDGLVSLDETDYMRATEHLIVERSHTFIMNDDDVIAFSAEFIGQTRTPSSARG